MTLQAKGFRPLRVGELLDVSLVCLLRALPVLVVPLALLAWLEQVKAQIAADATLAHLLVLLLQSVLPLVAECLAVYATASLRFGRPLAWFRVFREVRVGRMFGVAFLSLWTTVVTVLLLLLLVVPGVVYSINRLLVIPIYLLEKCSMRDALWRSTFLMTRGRWYSFSSPMMRVSVVMFVILVVVASLTIGYGARDYFAWGQSLSGAGELIVATILGLFAQILAIFGTVVYTNFYFDLRSRYEGLDLIADIETLDPGPQNTIGVLA